MANLLERLPQNVPGDFFVDSTCIDCDTCTQLAPETFRDHGDQCSVHTQPTSAEGIQRAMMALVSCPTGSIGSTEKHNSRIGIDAFPLPIAKNVFFCGFTSEATFGGWSYFIQRSSKEGGNVLIDSPRFTSHLVKRFETMGGIQLMFLTHKDDIGDHRRFAERFGCERIMHVDDGARALGVERVVEGEAETRIDNQLLAIPTPGHTRGHMLLLYNDEFLFTGDHLAWSVERRTLTAFRSVAWYSWKEQIRSMEKLMAYNFQAVLPGHGNMHLDTAANMRAHLNSCIAWMKS
jgi:glyoxylase-like metal-dependent hydrolase (beta-lactamase superfamily II)